MLWSPASCTAVVRHSSAASAPSSTGAPVTGPGWWGTPSSCPSRGRPLVASQRAVFSSSSARMDTAQEPAARTASWNRAIFSAQNSTSGGSSETEANALTVMAWVPRVVTTTMPLANWPAASRNETPSTLTASSARLGAPPASPMPPHCAAFLRRSFLAPWVGLGE